MRAFLTDIHFEILGVNRYSTKEEIKKAYRELIKKWHPDSFPNQPEKDLEALEISKKLNEAYSFLENYKAPSKPSTSAKTSNFYKSKTETSYKQPPNPNSGRLKIKRVRVKSSNIHSIGYEVAIKVLQVEFLNGSIYQYYNVPENIYTELMQATSKGKYFISKVSFSFKYESF